MKNIIKDYCRYRIEVNYSSIPFLNQKSKSFCESYKTKEKAFEAFNIYKELMIEENDQYFKYLLLIDNTNNTPIESFYSKYLNLKSEKQPKITRLI